MEIINNPSGNTQTAMPLTGQNRKILTAAAGIAATAMLAFATAGCQKEPATEGFTLDATQITLGSEGGIETIGVSSAVEWTVSTSQPWITVSPANGLGSVRCTVAVDTTLAAGMREGLITFSPVGLPQQSVEVHQTGFGNIISLKDTEFTIPASANYDNRYFETEVTANVEFSIIIDYLPASDARSSAQEWLSAPTVSIELDRGARPRTTKLRFDWKTNTAWEARAARISFVPSGQNAGAELLSEAVMTIRQEASPEITDDRAGDSLAILSIRDQLNMLVDIDATENLRNWDGITLWEKTDKDLPTGSDGKPLTDAIGRVRSASFLFFDTEETIPEAVKYLKYAESLTFFSNVNTMLKSVDLGSDICSLGYLKYLEIGAYGLVSLPDDFIRLSGLETLDLGNNNFTEIPAVLTQENFPNLRTLRIVGNRRSTVTDLRQAGGDDGIGLHVHMQKDGAAEGIRRLFLWDNLEELSLSYNYIEGQVPEFEVGSTVDGRVMTPYHEGEDFTALKDTVAWLWTAEGQKIPRILPNCRSLKINLNFFTGDAPPWIMYHPYLIDWIPEIFIFNQMEESKNSDGLLPQFDNAPKSFTYYFEAYPLYEAKYAGSD